MLIIDHSSTKAIRSNDTIAYCFSVKSFVVHGNLQHVWYRRGEQERREINQQDTCQKAQFKLLIIYSRESRK